MNNVSHTGLEDNKTEGWLKALFEKHILKFWVVRGALAAMSSLALITNVTGLERLEFLEFFHAIFTKWDKIANKIGVLIGSIGIIPVIPAAFINCFILGAVLSHAYVFDRSQYAMESADAKRATPSTWFGQVGLHFIFAIMLAYAIFLFTHYPYTRLLQNGLKSWLVYIPLATIPIVILFATMRTFSKLLEKRNSFRQGILFVLGLLASFEILYLLNLPILSDLMNETVMWLNS